MDSKTGCNEGSSHLGEEELQRALCLGSLQFVDPVISEISSNLDSFLSMVSCKGTSLVETAELIRGVWLQVTESNQHQIWAK